ncbi:hypothetical protein HYZ78_04170 [Candidatus Microgenomates bacterium]|nr:hypothetical protein [Candidatus Microgenomates bacterium]
MNFKYVVLKEKAQVFFSGLDREGSSTAKVAADVVWEICERAGINPEDFTFFDVMTHRGIRGTKPGWCEIYELRSMGQGTHRRVSRKRVAGAVTDADKDPEVLGALPDDYRDAFVRLIQE